jgi:hypothetical protein
MAGVHHADTVHLPVVNNQLWRIPLIDMKYEPRQDDGGDRACPPIPPLRFVITTYYLVEGLLHFGGS